MSDETGVVFDDVAEHFTDNFDESCFMANQDGSIKIVASGSKKKTEKNCYGCCESVTIFIEGNCFGNHGPFIFYIKGKHGWVKKFPELDSEKSMPPHSHVVPSTNAYMDDEVYLGIFPKLCKEVCDIPVVRDHKGWWCVWIQDIYASHVNVHISHEIFMEHKIMIVE